MDLPLLALMALSTFAIVLAVALISLRLTAEHMDEDARPAPDRSRNADQRSRSTDK